MLRKCDVCHTFAGKTVELEVKGVFSSSGYWVVDTVVEVVVFGYC